MTAATETRSVEDAPRSKIEYARRRLAGAQKSPSGVPAYMRFVNRKIGGQLAVLAYALRLTPTQVTVLSAFASFGGLVLIATQSPTALVGIGASALLLLGFALDSADGQLARVRGGGSKSGEWLDHVIDLPKVAALHIAVLIHLARFRGYDEHSAYLLVPPAYLLLSITLFFSTQLRDQLVGPQPRPVAAAVAPKPRPLGEGGWARAVLMLPLDYGTLCLTFALAAFRLGFLWVYAVLFGVNLVFAAHSLRKSYRALRRFDAHASAAVSSPLDAGDEHD